MSERMNEKWGGIFVGLVLVLSSGCQSARNAVYCVFEDMTDIVVAEASFSAGTDMGAHVMATELVQLNAYSYEDVYFAGFGPRRVGVTKKERSGQALSLVRSSLYNCHQDDVVSLFSLPGLTGKMSTESGIKAVCMESVDEVGVGAHLFFVGGRVGVRPLEVFDLFAGLFGFDPLHDNLSWYARQSLKKAKKSENNAAKEQVIPAVEVSGKEFDAGTEEVLLHQVETLQKKVERMQQAVDEIDVAY